jgi:transcriptional regulator with XRE-family HTH domain
MTSDEDGDGIPARVAAVLLRAARTYSRLSQRELAAKAGVSASTVARAEQGTKPPSWAVMARLVQAAGCSLRLVDPDGRPIEPWKFEAVRDRGGRHFPAHLEVWEVGRRGDWWGWLRYSTWASPPTPTHSFEMRGRRSDAESWW